MAFFAGQKLTAAAMNAAVPLNEEQSAVNTSFGTSTSTSYTSTLTGATTVTLAFVAPTSGKIEVNFTASVIPDAAPNAGFVSVALSGAAGTVAASDDWWAFAYTTDAANDYHGTVTRTKVFTGLVAGAAGVITMNHKVSAGSCTFTNRQVKYRSIGA